MNSDSECDEISAPIDTSKVISIALLPQKSRKKYDAVYRTFMDWQSQNNVSSFSENVILTYFGELAEKYKSSSLWALYSMLRSTLNIYHNINIELYPKLRLFLKRNSVGYRAKKAETFTPDEINKFIKEAPDNIYLATKVAMIVGIMGACRSNQLHSMNVDNFQDLGSALLVTVPKTKSKIIRKFTITDHFYEICKKYIDIRPPNSGSTAFFLNYHNGKCTSQNIGINKFGSMGKQIAKFLKLPNAELYTGHSFRKSSATVLADSGWDITAFKRHGQWKSTLVTEEYIHDSLRNNIDVADNTFQSESSTATHTDQLSIVKTDATSNCDTNVVNFIKTETTEELSNFSEENPIDFEDNHIDSEENHIDLEEDSDIELEDKLYSESNISFQQMKKENELLKRKIMLTEHKERKRLLRLQYDNELKEHEEKMNNIKLQRSEILKSSSLKQQFDNL